MCFADTKGVSMALSALVVGIVSFVVEGAGVILSLSASTVDILAAGYTLMIIGGFSCVIGVFLGLFGTIRCADQRLKAFLGLILSVVPLVAGMLTFFSKTGV